MCAWLQEALKRQEVELSGKQGGLDKERAKLEALQEQLKARRLELADKVRVGRCPAPLLRAGLPVPAELAKGRPPRPLSCVRQHGAWLLTCIGVC